MKKSEPSEWIQYTRSRINQHNPDTVFLIGGGKSLLRYLPDPSILANQNIITANNAYRLFPNALACHFADWVWYTWHKEELIETCNTNNITCCTRNGASEDNIYTGKGFVIFKQGSKDRLSTDVNKLNGNNTGHQIINIAYHLGFKKIILLGYDLLEEAHTHWHKDHKRPTNTKNFTEVMIPAFNTLENCYDQYGVQIFNINRESALKCFPYSNVEDFING